MLVGQNGSMGEPVVESVAGDGAWDDVLHEILLGRGWRSDRADLPEEGDRFEWPASIPGSAPELIGLTAVEGRNRFGTTIYVDVSRYTVYGPQSNDQPASPRAVYSTRAELLQEIRYIEQWRQINGS